MRFKLAVFLFATALTSVSESSEYKAKTSKKENLLLLDRFNKENAEEALNMIQAVDVLIKKNIDQKQKDILIANKASYLITLIRIDLLKSPKMELSSEGQVLVKRVEEALDELSSRAQLNEFTSNLVLMRGLLDLYNNRSYVENFSHAIALNPKSSAAPWMSFMLAEHYFEEEDYQRARAAYLKYFDKNNLKQKEFALYKLAWCMISLKEYNQAEKYLARLLSDFPKSSLGADPIKDLAYVSTLHRSDAEVVALAKSVFKGDSTKSLDYLMTVVSYRELRQQLKLSSPLLGALIKIKAFHPIQYKYHLAVLRSLSKEYASKDHYLAFAEAKKHFSKNVELEARKNYQNETEKMIKSYYETYTAKVKSPEAWTKKELNSALRALLSFHIKSFPESAHREQVLTAQVELCTQVKEYKCMLETHLLILADKRLQPRHESSGLEVCKIWDELYRKNPEKYREKSIAANSYFLKRFSQSPHAQSVALRLSEYLVDGKSYSKAVNVLEKTLSKNSNEDLFFRLQSARFKDEQYSEIIKDERMPLSPRLLEVRREAALQKAAIDKKAGRHSDYETAVAVYLGSNPEVSKATLVRKDFFSSLLQRKDFEKLSTLWNSLDLTEKAKPDYKETLTALWKELFKKGDFAAALSIIPSSQDEIYLYLQLLTSLALNKRVDLKKIARLEESQRDYLYSLVLLSAPDELWLHFLKEAKKPLSSHQKSIALWAYRFSTGSFELKKTHQSLALFGADFHYSESDSVHASLQKQINSLQMPKTKSVERFAKELEYVLARIKKIRKNVAANIEKLSLEHRVQVFKSSSGLEENVAHFILAAPTLKGVSVEQLAEYRKGLEEAAAEYKKQSQEYSEAALSLEEKLRAEALSLPADHNWPSEKYAKLSVFKTLKKMSQSQLVASLALWDLIQGEELKDKERYYRVKVSLLRNLLEKNSLLKKYISEELKENGLGKIFDELRMVANVQ